VRRAALAVDDHERRIAGVCRHEAARAQQRVSTSAAPMASVSHSAVVPLPSRTQPIVMPAKAVMRELIDDRVDPCAALRLGEGGARDFAVDAVEHGRELEEHPGADECRVARLRLPTHTQSERERREGGPGRAEAGRQRHRLQARLMGRLKVRDTQPSVTFCVARNAAAVACRRSDEVPMFSSVPGPSARRGSADTAPSCVASGATRCAGRRRRTRPSWIRAA
jgi:hypothetical protein